MSLNPLVLMIGPHLGEAVGEKPTDIAGSGFQFASKNFRLGI